MLVVDGIIAALVLMGLPCGYRRSRDGGIWQGMEMLAMLLASAVICYLVSLMKDGSFLAGIMGFAAALALICVAAGVALGALLGVIVRHVWPLPLRNPRPGWERRVIHGLCALAMLASMAEPAHFALGPYG